MSVQSTSSEAYRKIQPSLGHRQKQVYQVLKDATDRGFDMTNTEIARLLKRPINTVDNRTGELRKKGFVVQSCVRICGCTGYRAKAWKIKLYEFVEGPEK